jgi:sulfate permease, SulP family
MTRTHRANARRGGIGNLIGGFVAGLYSVPEGIGYASLAGVSPMLGIYSGMVPVAIAAFFTGSVLMMSTLTSAIALTMGGILDEAGYTGARVPQAVFTMALLAGLLMVALGALKLGTIVNYVSNAVMTGFVMGVAILIMVGKASDIFGYDPAGISNKVVKAAEIVTHPGSWDPTTTAIGVGTIVLAFALKAVPQLAKYALVLVVIIGTAVVWLLSLDTTVIADNFAIPTGLTALPIPTGLDDLPDLVMIPTLLLGSVSVAVVALAQGAGIRPAFPNPDGSASSASRDFLGQGLGNVAGAFFQATPTGGSLSRTAVGADGGATSRVAGFAAAGTVILLVVLLGPVVGQIPEAVIGGLLFVIGVELVTGRIPDARLAWQAGRRPMVLFAVTLLLTLTIPLQWAILGGAFLSLAAYVAASGSRPALKWLERDGDDWLMSDEIPATLPSDVPLLVRYSGPDFFADVPTVAERLPAADPKAPGVLVLDVGELGAYSSTMLKELAKYHARLAAAGSGLVLISVSEHARATLAATGLLETLGADNVLPADPHLVASVEQGMGRGRDLLEQLRARRKGTQTTTGQVLQRLPGSPNLSPGQRQENDRDC